MSGLEGLRWTAEQDSVLRAHYERRGAQFCMKELGRTFASVAKRARRLGLANHRRWTKADDDFLRDYWGTHSVGRLASKIKRTAAAVHWRARKLGLETGAPDGYEYVTNAAERVGYSRETLLRILKWAGLPLHLTASRPTGARRHFHMVDMVDADEAVSRWLSAEDVHPAAKARSITGETLRRWLNDARLAGFKVPPEPKETRSVWRVPSKIVDDVIAWRRSFETLSEASRRTGIKRPLLTRWLIAARVERRGVKPWLIPIAEVDRVVADHRESEAA